YINSPTVPWASAIRAACWRSYAAAGTILTPSPNKERAAATQGLASTAVRRLAMHQRTRTRNSHFSAHTPKPGESVDGKMLLSQTSIQTQKVKTNMSAGNLKNPIKRTSLIVYGADIFNCSRHDFVGHGQFELHSRREGVDGMIAPPRLIRNV